MRSIHLGYVAAFGLSLIAVACGGGGNHPDPRVIPGGGIGDGAIDGELNVYVIKTNDPANTPIADATVGVGDAEVTTDDTGLVVFKDVKGPQTVTVKAQGYRSTVWVGANGANVTVSLDPLDPGTPAQATLTGTIAGFDAVTVPANHVKAGVALYSQSDRLGDKANNLVTPGPQGSFCTGTTSCAWTLVSRAGSLHVVAAILDIDAMGTADPTDDVLTVIGWAQKAVTVEDGVNQSGLVLDMVEAGNLANLTIDPGTPPASLTKVAKLIGLEISADEIIQLPMFLSSDPTLMLAPKLAVFSAPSYRLTAIAQTTSGDTGAQSVLLRHGLSGGTLAAGEWLTPPTGVTATRTSASFSPVAGALVHNVAFYDAAGKDLMEITLFDSTLTTIDVPSLVALPATGVLTVKVGGIGATLDPTNFSLETDRNLLWGIAVEPIQVP